MGSDDWLLVGIIGAGAVIGLVLSNNASRLKDAIHKNVPVVGPTVASIIPVASRAPSHDITGKRMVCPPGMYLDQTMGIYRCHDAHGTRQLDPNVKLFNPQWQNAWASPTEPNMTQPLVQPDINKQIESEIKRKHQKEVKHQTNLDEKRLIRERATDIYHTQVECPHDISKLQCGSHCMKNGRVMVVDCSGQRNKKKETGPPSITVPPNFPGAVTVTPGPQEIGGTAPQEDIPPLELAPGQDQILPTIPPTTPGRGPTEVTPPQIVTPGPGKTIYQAIKHYPISNPAGKNENITYKSTGQHVVSHRVDVHGIGPQPSLEATAYVAWPSQCGGGGHPQMDFTIKFWGPDHTGSNCCYCLNSVQISKDGQHLDLGFGGEGPHPDTSTISGKGAKKVNSIPFVRNKQYGIKGMIWKAGQLIHQEIWYDDGSGWKKGGEWDRPWCGKTKTSTSPHPDQEIEFRFDCSNVTFSGTDVAAIRPPGSFYQGELGFIDRESMEALLI